MLRGTSSPLLAQTTSIKSTAAYSKRRKKMPRSFNGETVLRAVCPKRRQGPVARLPPTFNFFSYSRSHYQLKLLLPKPPRPHHSHLP